MIFKKTLVPVDFSTHSVEAIRVAADLSRQTDSRARVPTFLVCRAQGLHALQRHAAREKELMNICSSVRGDGNRACSLTLMQSHQCDNTRLRPPMGRLMT